MKPNQIFFLGTFILFISYGSTAQQKIEQANVAKSWVVEKMTVNGEVDDENYPTNHDPLDLKNDGTFYTKDNLYNYEQTGKWELAEGNMIKLVDGESGEVKRLLIINITDEEMATQVLDTDEKIEIFWKVRK